MLNDPTKYNELKRKMKTATYRSLTTALEGLEDDDLIEEYSKIPPKVEYSLSELSKSMISFLQMFCDWTLDTCQNIDKIIFIAAVLGLSAIIYQSAFAFSLIKYTGAVY